MLSCLPQFGQIDCNAASFLDASRSGGCSGAVVSGSAVVLSGFESVQGVADDRGGLVFGPPAVGLGERVDVGSERLAFLVGGSLDRAMQIGDSLSDGPADGVALAAAHGSSHIHGQHSDRTNSPIAASSSPVMIDPDPVNAIHVSPAPNPT